MSELNLTQGSVPRVLLRFSVPFLLANLLQGLYGGADLFFVGRFCGASSVAAVSIGSQVMQTVTGLIWGLSTGATVLLGLATGAQDNRQAASAVGSSIWLFGALGLALAVVLAWGAEPITYAMQTPPAAVAETVRYILVCALGILFIMGYNVVCALLRGVGGFPEPPVLCRHCLRHQHRVGLPLHRPLGHGSHGRGLGHRLSPRVELRHCPWLSVPPRVQLPLLPAGSPA